MSKMSNPFMGGVILAICAVCVAGGAIYLTSDSAQAVDYTMESDMYGATFVFKDPTVHPNLTYPGMKGILVTENNQRGETYEMYVNLYTVEYEDLDPEKITPQLDGYKFHRL